MGIKTVPQPPYSPDLAPCDFWLFPKLRGCCYETIEEIKEAVMKVIDMLTEEDFHGAFQKLLESTTSTLQPEEITLKGTRVSCVYYQWKCPYEKSLETYLMILIFRHLVWEMQLLLLGQEHIPWHRIVVNPKIKFWV